MFSPVSEVQTLRYPIHSAGRGGEEEVLPLGSRYKENFERKGERGSTQRGLLPEWLV